MLVASYSMRVGILWVSLTSQAKETYVSGKEQWLAWNTSRFSASRLSPGHTCASRSQGASCRYMLQATWPEPKYQYKKGKPAECAHNCSQFSGAALWALCGEPMVWRTSLLLQCLPAQSVSPVWLSWHRSCAPRSERNRNCILDLLYIDIVAVYGNSTFFFCLYVRLFVWVYICEDVCTFVFVYIKTKSQPWM